MKQEKPLYRSSDKRSLLVEVALTNAASSGVGEFKIGSFAQLRDAKAILSVEAFNTTLVTKAPSGATNLTDAGYKTCFLALFDGSNIELRARIPLAKLIRSNGNTQVEHLNMVKEGTENVFDPERSKVIIADQSTITAGMVVLLEFVYIK